MLPNRWSSGSKPENYERARDVVDTSIFYGERTGEKL